MRTKQTIQLVKPRVATKVKKMNKLSKGLKNLNDKNSKIVRYKY